MSNSLLLMRFLDVLYDVACIYMSSGLCGDSESYIPRHVYGVLWTVTVNKYEYCENSQISILIYFIRYVD